MEEHDDSNKLNNNESEDNKIIVPTDESDVNSNMSATNGMMEETNNENSASVGNTCSTNKINTDNNNNRDENDVDNEIDIDNDNNNDWIIQRDKSKEIGDNEYRNGNYNNAIQYYTEALSIDPDNCKILSNRSAAYLVVGQKSLSLYDAQQCVDIGTMVNKGISRLAAALQSLYRYDQALVQWNSILQNDPSNIAANKGRSDCVLALNNIKEQKEQQNQNQQQDDEKVEENETNTKNEITASENNNNDDDLLDDFFNDVQDVTKKVIDEKVNTIDPLYDEIATNAIKYHKETLGTAQDQVDRIIGTSINKNYFWYNLNPFTVFDLQYTASIDDISRRYKALSLLLHPDKNPNIHNAQLAYDEVLRAKSILLGPDNITKVSHIRSLIKQGILNGTNEWNNNTSEDDKEHNTIEEYQKKAVLKIFADIENKRRQVELNLQKQKQREQQQEEEQITKQQQQSKFHTNWIQSNRVDKRVSNWHNFDKDNKKQKQKET